MLSSTAIYFNQEMVSPDLCLEKICFKSGLKLICCTLSAHCIHTVKKKKKKKKNYADEFDSSKFSFFTTGVASLLEV